MKVSGLNLNMNIQTYHREDARFVQEENGFYSTTLTNLPAFREEPRMPPEDQVRAWMLVYYLFEAKLPPVLYWPKLGRELFNDSKSLIKVSDDIKKASAQVIGDAAT